MQFFLKMLSGMVNSEDPDQTSGAYAILSESVVYKILRHLPYSDCLCWDLTLVGHFVLSSREREKRDRREDEREKQGTKRKKNESEVTEKIKIFPYILTCCKDSRPCSTVSQYQLDATVTLDTFSVFIFHATKFLKILKLI